MGLIGGMLERATSGVESPSAPKVVAQRSEQRHTDSLGYELNGVLSDLSDERVRRPICESDKPAQRGGSLLGDLGSMLAVETADILD